MPKISSLFALIVVAAFASTLGFLIWQNSAIDVQGSFNLSVSKPADMTKKTAAKLGEVIVGGISGKSKEYVDAQYDYRILIPVEFYTDRRIEDGLYAYTKHFTSYSGKEWRMNPEDLILSVTVAHDGGEIYSSLEDAKKETQALVREGEAKVSSIKEIEIDGFKGFQQLEDYTLAKNTENGCRHIAYFQQERNIHTISLASGSCETLGKQKEIFERAIRSFSFEE